jgi:hypothetical protein
MAGAAVRLLLCLVSVSVTAAMNSSSVSAAVGLTNGGVIEFVKFANSADTDTESRDEAGRALLSGGRPDVSSSALFLQFDTELSAFRAAVAFLARELQLLAPVASITGASSASFDPLRVNAGGPSAGGLNHRNVRSVTLLEGQRPRTLADGPSPSDPGFDPIPAYASLKLEHASPLSHILQGLQTTR